MDDKVPVHVIFLANPIKQAEYVDKNVTLILKNGETLTGTVFTVDPVSQSVVLASRKNDNGETTINVVMNHSIKSMELTSNQASEGKILLDRILEIGETNAVKIHLKSDVKNWLEKNMIPVVERGDVLKIDNLEIHPPYGPDQCFSSNPIVLSRVQSLLRQMLDLGS